MNRAAALLSLALVSSAGAAAPTSLTVWIPEQGQTATLSSAGLVGAAGNRLVLNQPEYTLPVERPIAGGFARLVNPTNGAPTRLEIVQRGKVTASRPFPEAVYSTYLRGTQRGPCLSYAADGREGVTRCFTPDLKTEWAKLGGVMTITRDGQAAYMYDTAKNRIGAAYQPNLQIIRQNLTTGEQTPLTYRVPLDDKELEYHRNLAATYEVGDSISLGAELPGGRFVLCASTTLPKMYCRLDIVNRDLKRLVTLQGSAYVSTPSATADGKRLYFMGNTLQVWEANTGKRLSAIRDPLWEKRGQVPLKAYLTPDGTQAAILVTGMKNGHADYSADDSKVTAYLYRVQGGKLLNSFPVKP